MTSSVVVAELIEPRRLLSAAVAATTPTVLTGTVIGTAGSYHSDGNTIAKVFDGNLNNFFDGPTASGNYAGLDLGSGQLITQISYAPRVGYGQRMIGGVFQGSDSADFSGAVTTLYTVTSTPASGVFTTVNVSSPLPFRYVRYLSPDGSWGDVGEVQFSGYAPTSGATLSSDGTLTVYGTSGNDTIDVDFNLNLNNSAYQFTGTLTTSLNGTVDTFNYADVKQIVIAGLAGNDSISASDHSDDENNDPHSNGLPLTISGGDGNDTITSDFDDRDSATSFNVDGGAGNDQIDLTAVASVTVHGGDGNDGITVTDNGDVVAYGDEGNDGLVAGGYTNGSEGIQLDGGPGQTGYSVEDPDDNTTIRYGGESFGLAWDNSTIVGTVSSQSGAAVAGATVYLDLNDDGVLDAGDQTTTTDSNGIYSFTELNQDGAISSNSVDYVVRVVPPTGQAIAPGSPDSYLETLQDGGGAGGDNFTLGAPITTGGSISGTVTGSTAETIYLDANNNSVLDNNELSTTVQSNGTYRFTNVPAGAYVIRQILPANYTQSSPASGYGIHVTIGNSSVLTGENFTDKAPGEGGAISGAVTGGPAGETLYLDANNNGKLDPGEITTTLNTVGSYVFSDLPLGNYIVRQMLTAGYSQVTPSNNYGIHVSLTDAGFASGNNFTDKATAPTRLTGATIGTAGSYNNDGNEIYKATDGILTNFYDGAASNGDWVGYDLGSSKSISQIGFTPRDGYQSRMVGGVIQISTTADFSSGVTTIYTISAAPATDVLTVVTLSSSVTARYVRYLSPDGSHGDIAEFQVFG